MYHYYHLQFSVNTVKKLTENNEVNYQKNILSYVELHTRVSFFTISKINTPL
jgi:hypothetical protein